MERENAFPSDNNNNGGGEKAARENTAGDDRHSLISQPCSLRHFER